MLDYELESSESAKLLVAYRELGLRLPTADEQAIALTQNYILQNQIEHETVPDPEDWHF